MPPPQRSRGSRRHTGDDAGLADAVAEALTESELAARSEDIALGLVPVWARRSLHPPEIAARVSFAAIDRNEEATAGRISRRLIDDRRAFTSLLMADLAAQPSGRAVVDRLVALEVAGLAQIPGAAELLNATAADVAVVLRQHAETAGALVAAEAEAQGFPTLGVFALDVDGASQIDQLAHRLAVAPQVDLVRALRDEAVRLSTPEEAGPLVGRLAGAVPDLSEKPLELAARNSAAMADGLGRQAAAAVNPPGQIYASELLDGNTCGPCSLVDGHEYGSLEQARRDYPNGIYVDCAGGDRCRGTLVFVWATEAPPST